MSDDPANRSMPNLGGVRPGESLNPERQPRRDVATWRPAEPAAAGDREPPPLAQPVPPRPRTQPPAQPANRTLEPRWQPAGLGPPSPGHLPPPPQAGSRPEPTPPGMRPRVPSPSYTAPPRTQPPQGDPTYAAPLPPPPPRGLPSDFRGPKSIYRHPEIEDARGPSWIGKAVRYSLIGLVAIVGTAVAAVVLLPPTEMIRNHVIAEVKAKTGRDLAVGSARLTLVPSLGVNLKHVTLSAPPGMAGEPLLTARSVEVNVALLPLITREVQVERMVLVEPVVTLRVDASGRRSWDFAEAEPLRQGLPVRTAQAPPPKGQEFRKLPAELQDFAKHATTPAKPGARLGVSALSLGDVRITDGVLRYTDQQNGRKDELTGVNMRLALKDLGGPLNVKGDLLYQREKLNVDASVYALRELIEERATRLTARVQGATLMASYDGEIAGGGSAMDGRLTVKVPSAVGLARLLQLPLPGLEGVGAIGVEGQMKTGPGNVAFTNTAFALGDFAANGNLAVDLQSGRPQIKATLKIAKLDLDRLAALKEGLPAVPASARPSPAAVPANPPGPAQSIEDLLKATEGEAQRPPTAVRGFTKRDGWSQEALDLGILRFVDLDGRFTVGELIVQQIKASQTQLTVDLKGGVLKANIQDTTLYGGRGRGLVNLDVRQPDSVLGVNISADGVAAAALLKDAAGVDMIEGRGRLLIAVTSKGVSERDLVGALAGKAEFTLADGALLGWDANDLLGQMSQLKVPSFDRKPGARTPYSLFAATFQIANGVGRTQDIRFTSPSLQATGSGVVNLVDRNLNLLMKPKVASGTLANIDVPLRIAGNFDAIKVMPEGKGLETVKQLGRQVRDTDVDNVVRGVLGDTPEAQEKAAKAKELLRKFLRP
ncbi:MAG: AsmA family protein [Hyphomicrobiaceae bacterium]